MSNNQTLGGGSGTDAAKQPWEGQSENVDAAQVEEAAALHVLPLDAHNARLLSKVHPREHQNPATPAPLYNMVVVGAGAGLLSIQR